ncbi:hypothetical protein DERF_001753 [Dermatophagoides farinae]|uniref:Uncharacterized protein n=1 Tax=Dermatophagoides farinae TaxID=6954 RepID=A0A922IFH5_DERFA|nr:hypothetical protein DERF_001753 [Dermatophagoides farinae]
MVIWVQNDPTIPIQKGLQCDGKKDFTFHFSYYEGNLINSNGTFVPDNYEFPVFDDDLNVFLLNPNSIASFKILNSIILSIIRSIVKHICGTKSYNWCLLYKNDHGNDAEQYKFVGGYLVANMVQCPMKKHHVHHQDRRRTIGKLNLEPRIEFGHCLGTWTAIMDLFMSNGTINVLWRNLDVKYAFQTNTISSEFKIQNRENNKSKLTRPVQNRENGKGSITIGRTQNGRTQNGRTQNGRKQKGRKRG